LLNLNSTSSFSDCCNTKTQKDLTELTNQIQGWTGIPGPDETPVRQELSDHEPGAQGPGIGDMREKEQLETLTLEDKPALTPNAKPIPKGSGHSTDRYPKCGTGVTWLSRRRRRNLNAPEQRTLCETHRVKDKLMAAETEWARRRYMKPLEPLVRPLASILELAANWRALSMSPAGIHTLSRTWDVAATNFITIDIHRPKGAAI
jgi:hypothetical protein